MLEAFLCKISRQVNAKLPVENKLYPVCIYGFKMANAAQRIENMQGDTNQLIQDDLKQKDNGERSDDKESDFASGLLDAGVSSEQDIQHKGDIYVHRDSDCVTLASEASVGTPYSSFVSQATIIINLPRESTPSAAGVPADVLREWDITPTRSSYLQGPSSVVGRLALEQSFADNSVDDDAASQADPIMTSIYHDDEQAQATVENNDRILCIVMKIRTQH